MKFPLHLLTHEKFTKLAEFFNFFSKRLLFQYLSERNRKNRKETGNGKSKKI
jgi:hypothetical protein